MTLREIGQAYASFWNAVLDMDLTPLLYVAAGCVAIWVVVWLTMKSVDRFKLPEGLVAVAYQLSVLAGLFALITWAKAS